MKHKTLFFKIFISAALGVFGAGTSLAQRHADCDSAYWVGNTYALHFLGMEGIGINDTEASDTPCFKNGTNLGQAEENSIWLRFDISKPGKLRFTITPDVVTDDLDFVLYKLPTEGDCTQKKIVRCMAAGGPGPKNPCLGETGLRKGSLDKTSSAGCFDPQDDAWLAPLKVSAGERYVLLVSNLTASHQGFTIRFGGSCKFKS